MSPIAILALVSGVLFAGMLAHAVHYSRQNSRPGGER